MYLFELVKTQKNTKNIILILVLFLVIPLSSIVYVKNVDKDYFDHKESVFIKLYNEINEKIINESVLNKNSREIEKLSDISGMIEEIVSMKYENNLTEQAKVEKDFYDLIYDYQKEYDTDFIKEEDLLKKRMVFTELARKDLAEISNEVGLSGVYFLKFSLDLWFGSIGILFLILFLSDIWTSELENQQIKLIKVQPNPLKKYYNKKFITIFGLYLSVFLLYTSIFFVVGYIINGQGSVDYPIIIDNTHIIPISKYIVITTLVNLLGVILIMSVVELISMIIKNYHLTLLISFLSIYVANMLSEKIFSPVNYYFFFIFNASLFIKNYYFSTTNLFYYFIISFIFVIIIIRKITLEILIKKV